MNFEIEHEVRQLRTIAALYTKRSKYREAETVYKSLLIIQEKHLGQFSPELALTCYQLAEVYADLGQDIAARPLFERAVTIWEGLSHLKMIKPEETIFFMDALVALQMQNDSSHLNENTESGENSRSAA